MKTTVETEDWNSMDLNCCFKNKPPIPSSFIVTQNSVVRAIAPIDDRPSPNLA